MHPTNGHGERCSTGIEGLDRVLDGGLPRNCFYLVQGDPGSGKTTLGLQFLLEGVRRGEKVFYITLSETKDELLKVARSHGWSLEGISLLELSAIETLVRPENQRTVFHSSEVDLTRVSKLLRDEIDKVRPTRVVIDSLSELRLMAETSLRYRRQLLDFKQEFARYGSTALLLDDKMDNHHIGSDAHVLSLAHGVITLEQLSPDYGRSRRRLRVPKMRAMKFCEGFHDYVIEKGGLRVFPRLITADHLAASPLEQVPSGITELNEMLGGGLERGTTTLIIAPAGTGKSSLTNQFARQMAAKGERGVMFTFDETRAVLLSRAAGLGMDLAKHIQSGVLAVQQIDPAEVSPGEFADRIVRAVEGGCRLVVIDSLNGYLTAMLSEKYVLNQLHELITYLNRAGVLTLITMVQHGLVTATETPIDVSYIADTVVSLRYFEAGGEIKRAIAVVKKRSGGHEKSIREYTLESGTGLRIGRQLKDFHGILTGVPTFQGSLDKIMVSPDARA